MKKFLALLLALCMVLSMVACSSKDNGDASDNTGNTDPANPDVVTADTYTYNTYSTALGTNWNPHTWEMNADDTVLSYLLVPLTDLTIKDSETGEYQWIFVGATDIQDVTAAHQDDLVKYNCAETDASAGYVYEISLREGLVWQDGTPINADTYVYSMQQMLAPEMQNYRANNYYSGESAIAGAEAYFFQGQTVTSDNNVTGVITSLSDLVLGDDGVYTMADGSAVYFLFDAASDYFDGDTLVYYNDYYTSYGYDIFEDASYDALAALCDEDGHVAVTDETWALWATMINMPDWGNEDESCIPGYLGYDATYAEASWDTVGLYKVDDYTIRYVCATAYDYYYFLTSCTSNWIVHEELYESCKTTDATSGLVTSNYGTSLDTSMSCYAYKLTSLEDAKQMVFEKNETYFEFTKNDDGTLTSTTETLGFQVDGEYQDQYQMDKIVIDVMSNDAAKLAFLAGELDDWTPSADEVVNYTTSDQLYKVDETYTMRLFFHTNLDSLKAMDQEGNTNSVVLSNYNFRKAMSLAIDRAEFVTATAGYKAAYSMLSSLYFYDVYEDPASIYRNTDQAKQAICNVYGVEYGEGSIYATLDDAYASITGYNLTEAKNLFTQACSELVADGLYTEGQNIVIQLAYKAGTMDSSDQQQVTLLNKYLNDALAGTGFGTIELVAVDNLSARYDDVIAGTYAIGWGAWGGAAFYPFQMFRVYCDPDYTKIHESGCWDPSSETLTLTVNGEEVTHTWQWWSKSMIGTGEYANADNETRLNILSAMEENFLNLYYCIPMCTTTACYMLSYKLSYFTENYSIMYGFGGNRLLRFNYTDAEWAQFVADNNGTIGY